MKVFNNIHKITFMMDYYNIIRIGRHFNKSMNLTNVSYTGTIYYNQIVDTIRKCLHCPKFPHINSKTIYMHILPKEKPRIESIYDDSLFKWESIWKNIAFKFIQVNEREFVFKYMHEILPTRKRMASIGQGSPECSFCGAEESNLHFAYQCTLYRPVLEWFKTLLFNCCNFEPSMIKVLMFDIQNAELKEKNTCTILVATYITNIWIARKTELPPIAAIKLIKSKIMYNKYINLHRLKTKFSSVFSDSYKTLDFTNM